MKIRKTLEKLSPSSKIKNFYFASGKETKEGGLNPPLEMAAEKHEVGLTA